MECSEGTVYCGLIWIVPTVSDVGGILPSCVWIQLLVFQGKLTGAMGTSTETCYLKHEKPIKSNQVSTGALNLSDCLLWGGCENAVLAAVFGAQRVSN